MGERRPAWIRSLSADGVVSAGVGPLRLIARRESYTLAFISIRDEQLRDVPARNQAAARKAVIDAARKQLSDWAAELDALEHQEAARG